MRDVLIQQRAFVQHWLDDLAAGLTPTRESLEAALAALGDDETPQPLTASDCETPEDWQQWARDRREYDDPFGYQRGERW